MSNTATLPREMRLVLRFGTDVGGFIFVSNNGAYAIRQYTSAGGAKLHSSVLNAPCVRPQSLADPQETARD